MHATEHPGEPAWILRSHEAPPKSATPSWMAPPMVRESPLGPPPEMAAHEGESYSGEVPRQPPVPGEAHGSHEGAALREENAALVEENSALRDAHAALHAEHAALRAEHAALTERFDTMARTMESLRVQVLEASEPQLVELAMAVAGRVVGRELQTDPTTVAGWAREAVELFVTREGLVVSVAPDLASQVPPEAWASALATPHTLVVDPSRAPGSASVHAGSAEAGVGVVERMASVREALTEGVE